MLFDDSTSNNFVTSLYFYQELAQCPVRVRKVAQKASASANIFHTNKRCLFSDYFLIIYNSKLDGMRTFEKLISAHFLSVWLQKLQLRYFAHKFSLFLSKGNIDSLYICFHFPIFLSDLMIDRYHDITDKGRGVRDVKISKKIAAKVCFIQNSLF